MQKIMDIRISRLYIAMYGSQILRVDRLFKKKPESIAHDSIMYAYVEKHKLSLPLF